MAVLLGLADDEADTVGVSVTEGMPGVTLLVAVPLGLLLSVPLGLGELV